NVVTTGADSTANVTLDLVSGTGTLGGTATMAAVSGVATWTGADNLNVNLIGDKTLRATKEDTTGSGGQTSFSQNSDPFTITHAQASQLAFTTQPADPTLAGEDLLPVVEIRDAFGNLVSTGADATANVT